MYYKTDEKNENDEELYYLAFNKERYLFCHKNEDSKFIISDEVINEISNDKYKPRISSNIFPDKPFIQFLLNKMGMQEVRGRYGYYSSIRNKIDIIHGKPIVEDIDPDLHKVKIDDIYQLLEIFYRIFLQKPCEYFPKKKKYFRK